MDKLLAKMVDTVWGRNLLYTILGGMGGAIIWLSFENKRLNQERTADHVEHANKISKLRDYYENKLDTVNIRHLNFVQNALGKLEQLQKKKR